MVARRAWRVSSLKQWATSGHWRGAGTCVPCCSHLPILKIRRLNCRSTRSIACTRSGWRSGIRRLGGPRIDADEVLQEVFITVSRRLSEFRGVRGQADDVDVPGHNPRRCESPPGSATAQLLDRGGHGRQRLDALPSNQPTPGEALEERAPRPSAATLSGSSTVLPEHYRQVLVLSELEEYDHGGDARTLARPARDGAGLVAPGARAVHETLAA